MDKPIVRFMIAGNKKASVKIDSSVVQFWRSVKTGDPILVEQSVVAGNGAIRFKTISDQFHWNVRLDPNEFKARIPPDYQLVEAPQPGQGGGFGGSGRGAMMRSAGPSKSGQKARK